MVVNIVKLGWHVDFDTVYRRDRNSGISMESVLWYVLTGTRGGSNRARILQTIDEQPRNANQLAETLELDYKTIRHHLDVLQENGIVTRSGTEYGAIYLPTEQARAHWELIEQICEQVT